MTPSPLRPSARIGWRRGLRGIVLPALGLALLLALVAPQEPAAVGGLPDAVPGRGAGWLLGALVLAPLTAWQAARPRDARRTWTRSLPGATRLALGEAAGLGLACAVAVVLVGLGVEARQEPGSAWRQVRSVDLGGARRVPAGEELAVALDPGDAPPGARLGVEVASGGGAGPTTAVRLVVQEAGLDPAREEPAASLGPPTVIDGVARLRSALPLKSAGPVRLVVACEGPGDAVVRGGRSVVLEVPVSSGRQGSLELGVLLLGDLFALILAVASARALLGRGVAATAGLALVVGGWLEVLALPLPGLGFARALTLAGRGALAPLPGPWTWVALLLLPLAAWCASRRRPA
ncbi:MAG: hypothetical protein ISQ08_09770 [Planctomycetes bacterium]|nr:hypothetical protein [Planctomycetota bacterium]